MTLIDFLRHGETQSPGRLLGRTDAPLSEMGWQQFQRQTDGRRWALIVASPLGRARAPAERLAQTLGLNARIDADWSELDFGIWDGRPIEELQVDPEAGEQLDRLYLSANAAAAPQGESWRDLQVRVARALDRALNEANQKPALIVTHAGPMRAALALTCNIPFESLWAIRIHPATRITLRTGRGDGGALWGEIVEILQSDALQP